MSDILSQYLIKNIIPIINSSFDKCENCLSKLFLQIRQSPNDHEIHVEQAVTYLRLLIIKIHNLNVKYQQTEKYYEKYNHILFNKMIQCEIDKDFKDSRPLSKLCYILYRTYWMLFKGETMLDDIVILFKEVAYQRSSFDLLEDL